MKQLISTLLLSISFVLPVTGAARAEKHVTNACGCYGEGDSCTCEKNAKCGCPGECEPKGCEAKRQKQLQKEIDVETKRAKQEEKARNKPKDQAKSKEDVSDAAGSEKGGKGKSSSVKPMAASQKKQLLKLIQAYLAEYPESANKMLSEVRSELR
jgi:hypothetical protein